MLKEDFDNEIKEDLRRRGHTIQTTKSYIGRPVMLSIDQEEGTIYAAGDPEGGRHAAAMGD
jgi:gamma-glutamyltranspeptidase